MIQVNMKKLLSAIVGSYLFAHTVCAENAPITMPTVSVPSPQGSIIPNFGAQNNMLDKRQIQGGLPGAVGNSMNGARAVPGMQQQMTGTGLVPGMQQQMTEAGLAIGLSQQTSTPTSLAAPVSILGPTALAATPTTQLDDTSLSTAEKAFSDNLSGTEKGKPQQFQSDKLRQFGYSFFRTDKDSFSPQTDIPVGPDYTVGPGDSIILSAWGSLEGTYSLEVNRSGEIQLPRVGPLKVWGAPFERLPTLIRSTLAKVFRDFEINVTMGKLKVIKIYVVGEVRNPGDYNISSLSTVINALSAAGGPLKGGSLRKIAIHRSGKLVDTVDLYDFFLKGDKSRDIRLQSGDTIFVPIIGPTIGVAGSIKRPGIYELTGENNLKDLLELSGGLLPTGYLQRVQISRVTAHDRNTTNDFNLDPKEGKLGSEALASSIPVRDRDLVRIFPIDSLMRDQVRLEGYVLRPGDYALKPGMRVSNLLLPDNNSLPEFYREAGEITRLYPPDLHPEKIIFNPAKAVTGDQNHDLLLQEFDTVRLFSRWEMEEMPKVRISGEVQKPGEFRYYEKMTVRDLLMMAGNTKQTAYLKSAELNRIIQTEESVKSYPIIVDLSKALVGDKDSNIALAPNDELTIRKIPNWSEETDRYITLKGEFVFPGTYPIYKGEKLSSLITRAGGFTTKAYLYGAKFTRVSVQRDQQARMEESLARAEQDVARTKNEQVAAASSSEELAALNASMENLLRSIAKLKTAKAEGRVVLRLSQPDEFKRSGHDVELLGGDVLELPPRPSTVNIFGQVYNQTSLIHIEGYTFNRYLESVGGANSDADMDESYIIRADGSIKSHQNTFSFLFYNTLFSSTLNPGDSIVIPQRIERTAWMRNIKDVTTIIAQVAVAAGTVFLGLR
jgi:protein involved in polysaccharide export with SLBB domain